jgi:metal-responsive CopG/Arc/MetJ family transcriptional regulator
MSENRRKSSQIHIRIDPALKQEFDKYIEKMGYTASGLVTRWIREELQGRKSKSEAKAKAARENGKKGGRPRKSE